MPTPSETVIAGHEAFNQGDVDRLRELIAEDVRWEVSGDNPVSGTYEGRDAVIEDVLRPQFGPLELVDHATIDVDDFAVVLGTARMRLPDGTREQPLVEVCRVRDGRITERWAAMKDQDQVDAVLQAMAAQS